MSRLLPLSLALVVAALLACKKKEEDRPLPDPLPSAPATPETPTMPAAPTTPTPSEPANTATAATPTTPQPTGTTTTKPTTKQDAGTSTTQDAGTGTTPAADAGTKPSGSNACLQNCQTVLQTCITQRDGGFSLDTAKCQAAFQACQAGCK